MTKRPKLYDHTGLPVGGASSDDEHLPAGVQALIETRVNAAISDIREHNRDDLQDLARDHVKKWRLVAFLSIAFGVVSTLVAIVTTFYAPSQIAKWITAQVDKKLTEPMLKESADRVIDAKMSTYVDQQLSPLREQSTSLHESLQTIRSDVESKQSKLELKQVDLSKQLKIRELAIASKAGSRASYEQLIALQNEPDQPSQLLNASIKEIELFFDADRNQLSFPVLVNTSTLKDPGYAVDEVMYYLLSAPHLAEAAINTLSKLKTTGPVGELCNLVKEGDDLRAAVRATRALQEITGEKIRPLEFEKVARWWKEHSTNTAYNGVYDGYSKVVGDMGRGPISPLQVETFIQELDTAVSSDPDALHSRCLKAGFLLMLDRDEEARALLDEVEEKRKDYYWLHVWEAAVHAKTNNTQEAVTLINKAFARSPTEYMEQTIKRWNIFSTVRESNDIKWPSE
jgi:hypothetical protein